jgi:hypothetical protein
MAPAGGGAESPINVGDASTGPLAPDPPGEAWFEMRARTGLKILLGLVS